MTDLSALHAASQAVARTTAGPRPVRAPRCKRWPAEAACRMLSNNRDPEVAANPKMPADDGGTGAAARRTTRVLPNRTATAGAR